MIRTKIISSLEKCFIDTVPDDYKEINRLRAYKNERASLQLITYDEEETGSCFNLCRLEVQGAFADRYEMRVVESVPCYAATDNTPKLTKEIEPAFLRTEPGLYPDVLAKPMRGDCVALVNGQVHAAYLDFFPEGLPAGKYPTLVVLYNGAGEKLSENSVEIEVINAELPKETTRVANWLHADCLANYYNAEPFSERHFEICENFIKRAVENGINTILTPVFTPPLDTDPGCERTTTQLVKVKVTKSGYEFDFSLVDRWIYVCLRSGAEYFEISHLFTQWGGYHAPKIMAEVGGEVKRIFGWETDANSEEYKSFLTAFLTAFTDYLDKNGLRERTYFHLTDEPSEYNADQYERNFNAVKDCLAGWKTIDASSYPEIYRRGLVTVPVPSTGAVMKYLEEDIPERWCYYCCGPWVGYSNRFFGLSLSRTRSIGMQMYKYGIEGFLHWGYNFYNNIGSRDPINPFLNPAGNCLSGDAFCVYPDMDGNPLDSIRLRAFKQGLDDIRAMRLAENYYTKDEIIAALEEKIGEIRFDRSIDKAEDMLIFRDTLDEMIIAKL